MSTTRQHIDDQDPATWAALVKSAAADSVAAAQRLGQRPPAELVALAAMSERDLVEHRNRYGPARKRLSPAMRLVEADHMRVLAEQQTREAQQHRKDAEAAAAMARAEAEQSARAASAARERVREVQAESAQKEADWAAEREAAAKAAEQRETERAAERAAAQRALEHCAPNW